MATKSAKKAAKKSTKKATKKATKKVIKSSITGRFVTNATAKRHPEATETETVPK